MERSSRGISLEEIVNSTTHGIGLVLSVAGFVVLLAMELGHGTAWQVVGCAIYGSTLICLYLASTLYHDIPSLRLKRTLKIFDHSAIFLLIAGTYTPFLLVNLRGGWGMVSARDRLGMRNGGDRFQALVRGPFQSPIHRALSRDGLASSGGHKTRS